MIQDARIKLSYNGSLFWLIFWLIVFFPVGLILLPTALRFEINDTSYSLSYGGSRFWLGFWTILCFPVAVVLLFVNEFTFSTGRALLQPTH